MPCLSCSTSLAFKIASWVLNSESPCSKQKQGLLLRSCPLASLLWQESKGSSRSLVWQQKNRYKQNSAEIIQALFFWIECNTDVVKAISLKHSPQPCWRDGNLIRSHILFDIYFISYATIHTLRWVLYSPRKRKVTRREKRGHAPNLCINC